MNEAKTFVKSTTAYFFGSVLSKLFSFFMLPFYTAYISPEHYGYYDLTLQYALIITSVLFLDIWCGVMRFMFDSDEQQNKLKSVYSALPIYGASLALYFVIFTALNAVLHIRYFPLVLLYGGLSTLSSMYAYIVRGFGKNVYFACSGLACTVVTVLLNLIFIAGLKQSYWSLYAASSVGLLTQVILLERSVRLIANFSPGLIDKSLMRQMLYYSLPLFFNSAAYCFLTCFNRIVIVNVLGEAQNGYFAVAGKFSVAINLVGSCFFLAWQETSFRKEGENSGSGGYYSKAGELYGMFLMMGTICMLPAIAIVFQFLVHTSYDSARVLVPLSLLGTAISLYSSFLGSIFNAIKRTKIISSSSLAACAINIALLYLLINRIGVQAANVSLLMGYAVKALVRVILLRRIIGFRFSFKRLCLYLALFSGAVFVYLTRGVMENVLALLAGAGIMAFLAKDIISELWNGYKRHAGLDRHDERQGKNEIGLDDLRRIELNLLKELVSFCQEHHLRYYLAYGTLIGAVRHGGFIPWDDDIDVLMPRPDYEKLLQITRNGISEDIDVLNYKSTPGYIYPFAKVINNKTRMIEEKIGAAHSIGVFIDVFPIDGLIEDEKQIRRINSRRNLYLTLLCWSVYPIRKGKTRYGIFLKAMLYPICRAVGYRYFTEKLDQLGQKCDYNDSDQVAVVVWDKKAAKTPKEDYFHTVELEFEGEKFIASSNYHEHLQVIYGDYLKLPPPEKCVSHHKFQAYWE